MAEYRQVMAIKQTAIVNRTPAEQAHLEEYIVRRQQEFIQANQDSDIARS